MADCKSNGVTLTLNKEELQVLGMVLIEARKMPLTPDQAFAIAAIKEAIKPFWINS